MISRKHSNAIRAIRLILEHEGGFVNHPNDPGGATNMGVTIGTFRKFVKPNGTVDDLKNLTEQQAVIVYRRRYWDAVLADELPSGVDYAVADFAVNSGPSRAVKTLQKVIGVVVDGVMGPQTLRAVHDRNPETVIIRLCEERLAFLQRIKGGKLWRSFGRGWARRVANVRATAIAWAQEAQAEDSFVLVRPDVGGKPPVSGGFFALIKKLFGKGTSR